MKKILYVDMDNVLVDFQSAFSKIPQETLDKYKDNEDEIPGIFRLIHQRSLAHSRQRLHSF